MEYASKEVFENALNTTEALATAGKLNPIQQATYRSWVLDNSRLMSLSGVLTPEFPNESWEIDEIDVASRTAYPSSEGVDPKIRNRTFHRKVELKPQWIITPFAMTEQYLRRSLSGKLPLEDQIIRLMAAQSANNIEQMLFQGDKLGHAISEADYLDSTHSSSLYRKDGLFGLVDGLLKKAKSGHIVDAGNEPLNPDVINDAILAMPEKYRGMKGMDGSSNGLRLMVSSNANQQFLHGVSSRGDAFGASILAGQKNVEPFGVPFEPFQLLPNQPKHVEHIVLSGTTQVQLAYKNISDVVVTVDTLDKIGRSAFVGSGNDYTVDLSTGLINREAAGAIGDGDTVKVTYKRGGVMIYTHPSNIAIGVGLNSLFKRSSDAYALTEGYAMHTAVDIAFVNTDAVVLVENLQVA